MSLWGTGQSERIEVWEGVIQSVLGRSYDSASDTWYGTKDTILYTVLVFHPSGYFRMRSVKPTQARCNAQIIPANPGDPCKVFIYNGAVTFQCIEAPYFKECAP